MKSEWTREREREREQNKRINKKQTVFSRVDSSPNGGSMDTPEIKPRVNWRVPGLRIGEQTLNLVESCSPDKRAQTNSGSVENVIGILFVTAFLVRCHESTEVAGEANHEIGQQNL